MFQDTFPVGQSKLENIPIKACYNPHLYIYINMCTLGDRGSPMGRWGGVGMFTFIHIIG